MPFRAKIDVRGIYQGVEPVEELIEGDIEVPEDCSLKAGAYFWNAQHQRFDPLPKTMVRPAPDVPSLEEALYALIIQLPDAPAASISWAKYYETTIAGMRRN